MAESIRTTLTGFLKDDGIFIVPKDAFDGAFEELFKTYLEDDHLVLKAAKLEEASKDDDVKVMGTGDNLPFKGMAVTARFKKNDDKVVLHLEAKAPERWTFSDSFPKLGATFFSQLVHSGDQWLYLNSVATKSLQKNNDQKGEKTYPVGMYFEGGLSLKKSDMDNQEPEAEEDKYKPRYNLPMLSWFFGDKEKAEVEGAIGMSGKVPVMDLAAPEKTPLNLAFFKTEFGFHLTNKALNQVHPDVDPSAYAEMLLSVDLILTVKKTKYPLQLKASYFNQPTAIAFSVTLDQLVTMTLTELEKLLDGTVLSNLLPEGWHLTDLVTLKTLSFSVDSTEKKIREMHVVIGTPKPISVIDELLSIEKIVLMFRLHGFGSSIKAQLGVFGDVFLGEKPAGGTGDEPKLLASSGDPDKDDADQDTDDDVDQDDDDTASSGGGQVALQGIYPEFRFGGYLKPGRKVNVQQLIQHFLGDRAAEVMPDLQIADLDFYLGLYSQAYRFNFGVESTWMLKLEGFQFGMSSLGMDVSYAEKSTKAKLQTKLALGIEDFKPPGDDDKKETVAEDDQKEKPVSKTNITFVAEHTEPEKGWQFSGELNQPLYLAAIVAQLFGSKPDDLPDWLKGLSVEKAKVALDTTTPFTFSLLGGLDWPLKVNDVKLDLKAECSFKSAIEKSEAETPQSDDDADDEQEERITSGHLEGSLQIEKIKLLARYDFGKASSVTLAINDFKAVIQRKKGDVVADIAMGDLSVGDLITWVVHLVSGKDDFKLNSPWDVLNKLTLKGLHFDVNLSKGTGGVWYDVKAKNALLEIDALGLNYKGAEPLKEGDSSSAKLAASGSDDQEVNIAFAGKFLGRTYSKEAPLSWDLLNDKPPKTEGQDDSALFELRMLGLGHHVTFKDVLKLDRMADVLKAMGDNFEPVDPSAKKPPALIPVDDDFFKEKSADDPVDGTPLDQLAGLAFSEQSNWLIGADFSLLNTVSVGAVFNDPVLYGMTVSLYGDKAWLFAGLNFEIFYKKINDEIGEYFVHLQLPDVMRFLRFGVVSITLPNADISVFTNGNFLVSLGYPADGSFNDAAHLEIFPFVGAGGFYFGWLNGDTSDQVPALANGNWNPVLQGGLALQLGVGKTVHWSVFQGGATLTLNGALEGGIAFFNPEDPNQSGEYTYALKGTLVLAGRIYGHLDLWIAGGDVDASASSGVQLTMQRYQASEILFKLKFVFDFKVKAGPFKVGKSFKFSFKFPITIGRDGQPPWQIVAGDDWQPQAKARQAKLTAKRGMLKAAAKPWDAFTYFDAPLEARLYLNPSLTVCQAEEGIEPAMVPLLFLADGTEASATGFAQLVRTLLAWTLQNRVQAPSVSAFDQQEINVADLNTIHENLSGVISATTLKSELSLPYTQAMSIHQALLRAQILSEAGSVMARPGAEELEAILGPINGVYASQVAALFASWGVMFDLNQLSAQFAANFILTIEARPEASDDIEATLFPMPPYLKMTVAEDTVDFASQTSIDGTYRSLLATYLGRPAPKIPRQDSPSLSLTALLFCDYAQMIIKNAVQDAVDELKVYAATLVADESLADLAERYSVPERLIAHANRHHRGLLAAGAKLTVNQVIYRTSRGDTLADVAGNFGVEVQDLAAFNQHDATLLRAPQTLVLPNWSFTPQAAVTLSDLRKRFFTDDLVPLVNQVTAPGSQVLLEADAPLAGLTQVKIATFSLEIAEGTPQDLQGLAVLYGLTPSAIRAANPGLDFSGSLSKVVIPQCVFTVPPDDAATIQQWFNCKPLARGVEIKIGEKLNLEGVRLSLTGTQSLFDVSMQLFTTVDALASSLAASDLLAGGATMVIPPFEVMVSESQSYSDIAVNYDVDASDLALDNAHVKNLFNQGESAKVPGATLRIGELLDQMSRDQYRDIAGMVSRFMLMGMRLPRPDQAFPDDPNDWGNLDTQGLYALSGQQVSGFDIDTGRITLSASGTLPGWLNFADNQALSMDLSATEKTTLRNLLGEADTLEVPQPTFCEPYITTARIFSLANTTSWASNGFTPAYQETDGAIPVAGGPFFWSLPLPLQMALQTAEGALELHLAQKNEAQPEASEAVGFYCWATQVNLEITRLDDAPVYRLQGLSIADRKRLLILLNDWQADTKLTANLLYLVGEGRKAHYQSDLVDDDDLQHVWFFRTSLPLDEDGEPDVMASFQQPRSIVKLLLSMLEGMPTYLAYSPNLRPEGLPDSLFAGDNNASISLVFFSEDQTLVRATRNCLITASQPAKNGSSFFVTAPSLHQQIQVTPSHQVAFEWFVDAPMDFDSSGEDPDPDPLPDPLDDAQFEPDFTLKDKGYRPQPYEDITNFLETRLGEVNAYSFETTTSNPPHKASILWYWPKTWNLINLYSSGKGPDELWFCFRAMGKRGNEMLQVGVSKDGTDYAYVDPDSGNSYIKLTNEWQYYAIPFNQILEPDPGDRREEVFMKCPVPFGIFFAIDGELDQQGTITFYIDSDFDIQVGEMKLAKAKAEAEEDPPSPPVRVCELAKQYHLLGYQVIANGDYKAGPEAPAVAPNAPEGLKIPAGKSYYNRAFTPLLTKHAEAQAFTGLPNPYQSVDTELQLQYSLRDFFGNQLIPKGLKDPVRLQRAYFDPLMPLGQWPGMTTHYLLGKDTFGPSLLVDLSFARSLDSDFFHQVTQDQEQLKTYLNIYHQLTASDVQIVIEASFGTPSDNLNFAHLKAFAERIMTHLQTRIKLAEASFLHTAVVTATAETNLGNLAESHHLSLAELSEANRLQPGLFKTGESLALPKMTTVGFGDTFASLQGDHQIEDLAKLANLNADRRYLLQPGVSILVAEETFDSVQLGDSLNQIAARNKTEASQLVALNANNRDLLRQSSRLCLGLTNHKAATGDTLATLALCTQTQVSVAEIAEANAMVVLTEGVQITLGARLKLEASADFDKAMLTELTADTSLKDLVGQADLGQWFDENKQIVGVFDTNKTLVIQDVSYTPQAGDCMASVHFWFRTQGGFFQLDRDAFLAAFANQKAFRIGALLLTPPGHLRVLSGIKLEQNTQQITPVTTAIVLSRAANVAPDVPQKVARVRTLVTPQSEGGDLVAFASGFEAAFDGKLKLAQGDQHASDESPALLWAVPLGGVISLQAADEDKKFYAPRLLANTLMGRTGVPIKPYQSAQGLGEVSYRNFENVDLNQMAHIFLQAVDMLLSGSYSASISAMEPDAYARLLQIREQLELALAADLTPILVSQSQESDVHHLKQSRLEMRRQIRALLAEAYNLDGLAQAYLQIESPFQSGIEAPKLEGLPQSNGEGITFSSADFSLTNGTVTLDFAYRQGGGRAEAIDLSYQINRLRATRTFELNGKSVQIPLLLSFPIAIRPLDLHQADMPILSRQLPAAPSVQFQRAVISQNPKTVAEAKRWVYECEYAHDADAQDEIEIRLNFNSDRDLGLPQASHEALHVQEDLFQALAQFDWVRDALTRDLQGLAQLRIGEPPPEQIKVALATFLDLADAVASQWAEWQPESEAEDYTDFRCLVREHRQEDTLKITVVATQGRLPTQTGLPVIKADPQVWQFKSEAAKHDRAEFTFEAVSPGAVDSLNRTLSVSNLNVMGFRNAIASLRLLRNQDLVTHANTNSAFVYTSPVVTFNEPVTPLIDMSETLVMKPANPETLPAYLGDFFTTLLDMGPSGIGNRVHMLNFALSFGFQLNRTDQPDAILKTKVPLLLQPKFAFSIHDGDLGNPLVQSPFAERLGQYLFDWLRTKKASRLRSSFCLDLTLSAGAEEVPNLMRFMANNTTSHLPLSRSRTNMPLSFNIPDDYFASGPFVQDEPFSVDSYAERLLGTYGSDIYDVSTMQIAFCLKPEYSLGINMAQQWNRRMLSSFSGTLDSIRGWTKDKGRESPGFKYGGKYDLPIPSSEKGGNKGAGAFYFRLISDQWFMTDPLTYDTKWPERFTSNETDFFTWIDWKPITGENGWAALLGPLHQAYRTYGGRVPYHAEGMQIALNTLPCFDLMQHGREEGNRGALFYAPKYTAANEAGNFVDPYNVSNENNFSSYSGLAMLMELLADASQNESDPETLAKMEAQFNLTREIVIGMRNYFQEHLLVLDEPAGPRFNTGGTYSNTLLLDSGRFHPGDSETHPFAVDVHTWGITTLGVPFVDNLCEESGLCYRIWQTCKKVAGYFLNGEPDIDPDTGVANGQILGVGYSNNFGNYQYIMSAEWTFGAIILCHCAAQQYRQQARLAEDEDQRDTYLAYANHFYRDALTMTNGVRFHLLDTSRENRWAYYYANQRYMIPFGWFANRYASLASTAWACFAIYRFNPFVIEGDLLRAAIDPNTFVFSKPLTQPRWRAPQPLAQMIKAGIPVEDVKLMQFMIVNHTGNLPESTTRTGMPLSFYAPMDYWESLEGYARNTIDTVTERLMVHYVLDIYDASTLQVAMAIYPQFEEGMHVARLQTKRLISSFCTPLADLPGVTDPTRVPNGYVRAWTDNGRPANQRFYYGKNKTPIYANGDPAGTGAFYFRSVADQYAMVDPLTGSAKWPGGGSVDDSEYLHMTDWKPITGENAWALLIGPLQVAVARYGDYPPMDAEEVQLALKILPALKALQSDDGGLFYVTWNTAGNKAGSVADPFSCSNENNFSAYAGLQMLQEILEANGDETYLPDVAHLVARLEHFFEHFLLDETGIDPVFFTGGTYSVLHDPGTSGPQNGPFYYTPKFKTGGSDYPFAVDVHTWGCTVLGVSRVDTWWKDKGVTAYQIWQNTKKRGAYFDDMQAQKGLQGVGYTDRESQPIVSAEWTFGGINVCRVLAAQYDQPDSEHYRPDWAEDLRADADAMETWMRENLLDKESRAEDCEAYYYANRRYAIPFGWFANRVDSLASTAWAVMMHAQFNPFRLGGGLLEEPLTAKPRADRSMGQPLLRFRNLEIPLEEEDRD